LVKPHVEYSVVILKTPWLRSGFGESHRLFRVDQAKELVAVRVWIAPDQSWRLYCRQKLCV